MGTTKKEIKDQLIDFLTWFDKNVMTIDQAQTYNVWIDAYLKSKE